MERYPFFRDGFRFFIDEMGNIFLYLFPEWKFIRFVSYSNSRVAARVPNIRGVPRWESVIHLSRYCKGKNKREIRENFPLVFIWQGLYFVPVSLSLAEQQDK